MDVWTGNLKLFRFSKTEATVYGKHGHRRRLMFSMVVVRTAMAMGSQFVWNSNKSCGLLVTDVSRMKADCPGPRSSVCKLPGFRLGRRLLLPVDPADSQSTFPLHSNSQALKGPTARGQGERGREPLPAKQTCSLSYPLYKNKCLPGVSPGRPLFVFSWVDSKDWSQLGSHWEEHRIIWGIPGLFSLLNKACV